MGKQCALSANLYDLKTETAERGALVNTACEQDELMGALGDIARQLAGD